MPRLYREAPLNSIWEGSGNVNASTCCARWPGEPAEPWTRYWRGRAGARRGRRRGSTTRPPTGCSASWPTTADLEAARPAHRRAAGRCVLQGVAAGPPRPRRSPTPSAPPGSAATGAGLRHPPARASTWPPSSTAPPPRPADTNRYIPATREHGRSGTTWDGNGSTRRPGGGRRWHGPGEGAAAVVSFGLVAALAARGLPTGGGDDRAQAAEVATSTSPPTTAATDDGGPDHHGRARPPARRRPRRPRPRPPSPSRPPRPSSSPAREGAQVKALQHRLHELGYQVQAADGQFGPETHHSVVAFQKVNHLGRDGGGRPHHPQGPRAPPRPQAPLHQGRLPRRGRPHPPGRLHGQGRQDPGDPRRLLSLRPELHRRRRRPPGRDPPGQLRDPAQDRRLAPQQARPPLPPGLLHRRLRPPRRAPVPPFPASHGCIRITTTAMDRWFAKLPVGTPMLVYRS